MKPAKKAPRKRTPTRILNIGCPKCGGPQAMVLVTRRGEHCGYCPHCAHTWDVHVAHK